MILNQEMKKILTIILPGITFLLGLIVTHYYELFKNRMPKLKYRINKFFLGATTQDNLFGKVEVLYNDNSISNLYLCSLDLINTSNKDFQNVELTVWCDTNSIILVSHATKHDSIDLIKFTQDYYEEIRDVQEDDLWLVYGKRPYIFPVINRDDHINFSCLVTNKEGQEPNIYLCCDHLGLKIEANYVQPQLIWGESQALVAMWGIFIAALITVPVVAFIKSQIIIAIMIFFLCTFCIIPAVLLLKFLRFIKKIFR